MLAWLRERLGGSTAATADAPDMAGYVHSADGGFCRDLNECSQPGQCDNGQCVNMEGSFKCICDPGYELASNGKTCQDINACSSNPCLWQR